MKKKTILIVAAVVLVLYGMSLVDTGDGSGEKEVESEENGLFSGFANMFGESEEEKEEPDETFADYKNAEIEPFKSFAVQDQEARQYAAMNGNNIDIWWFADSVEVVAIAKVYNQYSMNFTAGFSSAAGEITHTLLPQGRDESGNYVFAEEWSKNRLTMASDMSWLNTMNLKTYNRASLEQCDKVLAYSKRKSLYISKKYWVFTDFFQDIQKTYQFGPDPDADMMVWGNQKDVFALAYIPMVKKYAFATYEGWTYVGCDAGPQGQGTGGGTSYLVARNDMNIRYNMEVSADKKQLTIGDKVYPRLTIRKATRLIEALRDEQDKNTTPEQFNQMYQTYANLAASKMQTINNLNIKEVYKFSVRSELRDAQQKMRQIRQRAMKIGFQMQPSPYEGQDPSYDPGIKYQMERDGVRYGQPKYRHRDEPRAYGE